ncbi:MAG: cytidine deaminase [Fimbriimonadaceae bacterium]
MERLVAAAAAARPKAYAPYSGYLVGAAVLDAQGSVFTGVNVENISYGATICAERGAVAKMVSEGGGPNVAVAVVTVDGGTPCGMCLQVLVELAADAHSVWVGSADLGGLRRVYRLADLMPASFASESVRRTLSDGGTS